MNYNEMNREDLTEIIERCKHILLRLDPLCFGDERIANPQIRDVQTVLFKRIYDLAIEAQDTIVYL